MKASERLRELDGGMEPAPWGPKYWNEPDRVGLSALRNALPLIADCIEAAEEVERAWFGGWVQDALHGSHARQRDTLTALRDALQGEAGSPPPPEGATAP